MSGDRSKSQEWPAVMLRSVDGIDVALWEDAGRIDPDALSWVEIEPGNVRKNGLVDVTVRVCPHRLADVAEGLSGKRDIADAIRWTIDRIAHEVNEDDYLRGEVESLPLCAVNAAIGSYGLALDWSLADTSGVMAAIAISRGNVSGIVLKRRGSPGKKTVPVVVFLPPALFDAAWSKRLERKSTSTFGQCVLDAIWESYDAEARPSTRPDSDDIPF